MEISCGSRAKEHYALEIKSVVDKKIREAATSSAVHALLNLDIEANFSALKFPATKTVTMQDASWLGFHIELAPNLRIDPKTKEVPSLGWQFADVIIGAMKELKLSL